MLKPYRPRILVQVKHVENTDDNEQQLAVVNRPLKVLDNQTLQVNSCGLKLHSSISSVHLRNASKIKFDCVGSGTDLYMLGELSHLTECLLTHHENCCLIRFNPQRESQLSFLCNFLTRKIDNRLHILRSKVHSIQLEYFDVRKYDMVNLLYQDELHVMPKSQSKTNLLYQFNNIMELVKWLQIKFVKLWEAGHGHDYLDFKFNCIDDKRVKHTLKFVLMQFYLNKMDSDIRSGLLNFFEDVGNEKKAKPLMLIDCLRDYVCGDEKWRTWLMFDVTTINESGIVLDDMLRLANAAYQGVNSPSKENSNDNMRVFFSSKAMLAPKDPVVRRLHPTNSKTLFKKKTQRLKRKYSKRDLNTLSSWYCKIDAKYASAIAAMEAYYERKYNEEISKISSDIRNMVHNIDDADLIKTISLNNPLTIDVECDKFRIAMTAFSDLLKEVEISSHPEILKVYLKTKTYDLRQFANRFKVKQLKTCQERICDIINEEVSSLSSFEFNNQEIDKSLSIGSSISR